MSGTPLIIGPSEKMALHALKAEAEANPVDLLTVVETIKTPDGKRKHMKQMTAQSIDLPVAYVVTYSLEDGHPIGRCRHMSMSVSTPGRIPNAHAVLMVAKELGFQAKDITDFDHVWLEGLQPGPREAINVIQKVVM